MAEKNKNRTKGKSERSEVISFTVNMLALAVVMVVLGFYIGSYVLGIWSDTDVPTGTGEEPQTTATSGDPLPAPTPQEPVNQTEGAAASEDASPEPSSAGLTPVSSGLYRVQVGSYDERNEAEVTAGNLRREGYEDAWVTSTRPFRVQVGAFSDPDNASRIVKDLETAGYTVFINE